MRSLNKISKGLNETLLNLNKFQMRGLNLKEIMSKSNTNQQGSTIATYGQAYWPQKSIRYNNFARASRIFVHFFAVTARLRSENTEFHVLQRM